MADSQYRITRNKECGYSVQGERGGEKTINLTMTPDADDLDLLRTVELLRNIPFCGGYESIKLISSKLTAKSIPTLILRPENGNPLPVLIFLHGFSTSKEKIIRYALRIAAEGYAVIIPDLPHHGERSERPFGEEYNLRKKTAEALCNRLHIAVEAGAELNLILNAVTSDAEFDSNRCALAGISMGGTVALIHAAGDPRIKAVLPFVSVQHFEGMAKAAGSDPLALKTDTAILKFDPVIAITVKPSAAILLQTGAADREVPKECGRALDAVLSALYHNNGNYRFIEHAGAGHEVTEEMLTEAIRWLKEKM